MIRCLNLYGCQIDILGKIDGNYGALYSLYLNECSFSDLKFFEMFLSFLKRTNGLMRLELNYVKLRKPAVLSTKFLDIIQVNPIKHFDLW